MSRHELLLLVDHERRSSDGELVTSRHPAGAGLRPRRVRRKTSGVCAACGGALPRTDRIYCDTCLPEKKHECQLKFTAAGQEALTKLRARGRDPMRKIEVQSKLRTANLRRIEEERRWDESHERPDAREFLEDILPALRSATLTEMKKASGLSITYCATIKHGVVPHPRHWGSLRRLVQPTTTRRA